MLKCVLAILASLPLLGASEIFQVSTVGALRDGVFNGDFTLKDLKLKGDFGVGVTNHLDGDWVAYNGKFYRTTKNITLEELSPSEKIPYGVVTFFKAPTRFTLKSINSLSDLTTKVEGLFKNKNIPYAILIEGTFTRVDLENSKKQSPPYTELKNASMDEYKVDNEKGMLIGFWFPPVMNPVSVPRLHVHYLPRNHAKGGRVVNVKAKSVKVAIQGANNLDIYFPKLHNFANARISENSTSSRSGS
ncbi:MAG: Alpha-acetolactate decarboxylase [Chlamydiia bacterium]|nr:Alpha-acetolactate decarboxylase [Chlamydiia bacterium]MCH9615665.1 Alpha-acetolactate decarboxylase [Chlamydiia bacterium]MCH9628932.1 Alpha-acetolactate decarboxylase [Chlamydiia bacterium]